MAKLGLPAQFAFALLLVCFTVTAVDAQISALQFYLFAGAEKFYPDMNKLCYSYSEDSNGDPVRLDGSSNVTAWEPQTLLEAIPGSFALAYPSAFLLSDG